LDFLFEQFNWHDVPDNEKKRRSHSSDPVYSPTMAGGLFAIDKVFFDKLGTYDDGFDIWGGENLELSFKVISSNGPCDLSTGCLRTFSALCKAD
jgi:polypeptide N-acetylgalactosaminyltransferase